MAEAVAMLPDEWLEQGAAIGSLSRCATRLAEYRAAGADQLLLHGTTPDQQEDIVAAGRALDGCRRRTRPAPSFSAPRNGAGQFGAEPFTPLGFVRPGGG